MKGVTLLLGNDLAGDEVLINPCVSSHPCSHDDTDGKMQDTPGLYPVCVVTCAITKKQLTMQNSQNKEPKSDVQSQPSVPNAAENPPHLTDIFKNLLGPSVNLLDYVATFRYRLFQTCEVANQNLQKAQT